ncbi:MAG: hypothetical protein Kow0069_17630 [Promethearchaeota archaeon]
MIKILVLNSLGFFVLGFFIPQFCFQVLGSSGTQIGLLWSLQTLGFLFSSAVVGVVADRSSKKFLLVAGSVGRGLAYLLLYAAVLAKNYLLVAIGMFSLVVLVGSFWIPFNALLSQKSRKEHRSRAFGLKSRATGLGSLVGGVAGMGLFVVGSTWFPTNLAVVYSAFPVFGIGNLVAGLLYAKRLDGSWRSTAPILPR